MGVQDDVVTMHAGIIQQVGPAWGRRDRRGREHPLRAADCAGARPWERFRPRARRDAYSPRPPFAGPDYRVDAGDPVRAFSSKTVNSDLASFEWPATRAFPRPLRPSNRRPLRLEGAFYLMFRCSGAGFEPATSGLWGTFLCIRARPRASLHPAPAAQTYSWVSRRCRPIPTVTRHPRV